MEEIQVFDVKRSPRCDGAQRVSESTGVCVVPRTPDKALVHQQYGKVLAQTLSTLEA